MSRGGVAGGGWLAWPERVGWGAPRRARSMEQLARPAPLSPSRGAPWKRRPGWPEAASSSHFPRHSFPARLPPSRRPPLAALWVGAALSLRRPGRCRWEPLGPGEPRGVVSVVG